MVFTAVCLVKDDRAVAEIKNDLNNALGYDVFFAKRGKMIHLPDSMYHILNRHVFWYIKIAIHNDDAAVQPG